MGTPISVSHQDWKTPLGELKCDTGLADAIVAEGKIARTDETAHISEHSCEVQLPFLQVCAPSIRIVCICMAWQDEKSAQDLAGAIFSAARKLRRNVIVIASSDFTHYESAQAAKEKDSAAIALLGKMDWEGFESLVEARLVHLRARAHCSRAIIRKACRREEVRASEIHKLRRGDRRRARSGGVCQPGHWRYSLPRKSRLRNASLPHKGILRRCHSQSLQWGANCAG
jgi:AmmeMemoRadiSam system protein B